ncbi:CotH kinase family protein [Oscillospiraceae bacterium 38-13]
MATHKHIDRICAAALALCLLLAAVYMNGEALGLQAVSTSGYENRLFDTERVHTLDIVMDGWDEFLETCENEEYSSCTVVIDGESFSNTATRAKGNTSLSMVSAMDSDRYSFKLEFDHYDNSRTYHGLDKLCLNNIIQDNTYMKDYLVYRMMAAYGVNAPLCSYVYLTVNGEDWGLYLAVEGVEDGFLQRNYGKEYGSLYKPDTMNFGGGRGNGRDFRMEDLENMRLPENPPAEFPEGGRPGGMPEGMGSSDVKLQYIDEDPESYANIFDSAKTDITKADRMRLIQALKILSEEGAAAVDVDQTLRYFAVHNFVCNGDSYTGSMVHNYYLYEEDGKLSMIPWDYNLAFGTFQSNDAGQAVNDPIDTPLSVTGSGDRPMIDWIFSSEDTTRLYHQYMAEFLETVDFSEIIRTASEQIAPYVEKDPTKFCTFEEFELGVKTLQVFCELRAESVAGQLAGSIPSTKEGQDGASLVDASSITLSDMGTMNQGGGPGAMPRMHGENGEGHRAGEMAPQFPALSRQDMEADGDGGPVQILRSPPAEGPNAGEGSFPSGTDIPVLISSGGLLAGILLALLYRRRKPERRKA